MSDTCIVCLGDLGEGASEPPPVVDSLPRLPIRDHSSGGEEVISPSKDPSDDTRYIAHLIPCGHNLHNECLKPWVERANSCPICRQNFNTVELSENLGGTVVASYNVEDRIQAPIIDPSLLTDDLYDNIHFQPCPICGDDDNEDLLLLCDGCEAASHTYCVGLDAVPDGPWYCCHCENPRSQHNERLRSQSSHRRRTRGEQRQQQARNQAQTIHWARVWQTVWDHLNLDLDFPFDDEQAADRLIQQRRREAANRREIRAWERRFRQRSSNQSRNNAAQISEVGRAWPSRPRLRIATPEPESIDEIRAWNAFERAREIQEVPSPSRRKRSSPTASPAEPNQPEPEPERRLKRPRTRRTEELADILERGESSRSGRPTNAAGSPTADSGPTFLQSLLKEVEDSDHHRPNTLPSNLAFRTTDATSPASSSPVISPAPSSCSSPRPSSLTSPHTPDGAGTPASSTSDLPNFPSEFSPPCSPTQGTAVDDQGRLTRHLQRLQSNPLYSSRSADSSPTRSEISLPLKSDLQKIVRAALKPHYRKRLVSKEEYTEINKRISRMLYDLAASDGVEDPLNAESKARWACIADTEVTTAVRKLQEIKFNETGESSAATSS